MPRSGATRFGACGRITAWVLAGSCALAGGACQTTVDSLGYNDQHTPTELHKLIPPKSYPNAFGGVLGKSEEEISAKIDGAFQQLFFGDPGSEAIYVEGPAADEAFITDVLHSDVRTEGIGLGMIIALELDKQDVFDKLWTYAKNHLMEVGDAAAGYFKSSCALTADMESPCFDPYGMEHMLMALLLAHERWPEVEGGVDYKAEAKRLLTVMRHKEDENGGIVDGVTNTFDASTGLVFDFPQVSAAGTTRPSIEMPAFYSLWAEATADPFWTKAATAGRQLWKAVTATTNPMNGLIPVRSRFDGTPDPDTGTFGSEAYRAFINIVLDRIWSPTDDWDVAEANNVLQFFIAQGMSKYVGDYQLDGTPIPSMRVTALVIVNGIMALNATIPRARDFIDEVWNLDVPTGQARYYPGILHMMGLLILSGRCRVYGEKN